MNSAIVPTECTRATANPVSRSGVVEMTVVICKCGCKQTFNYETRRCVLCKKWINVVERME